MMVLADHSLNTIFLTVIESLGTLAFAISGIRLAAAKQFDWFGAYVVGFITATGGGTLRDLLLGVTPFWMQSSIYLLITFLAFLSVLIFGKKLIRLTNTFFIFDTIGLALFVVVGMQKAIDAGFPFWVSIIMGMITGIVGSIIRDTLINEEPLVFRKDIYALACVAGGVVYWVGILIGFQQNVMQIVTAATVIVCRLVAVKYHLGLPALRRLDEEEE